MDNNNVLDVLRTLILDYKTTYNIQPSEIAKICGVGRSTIFYIVAGNYRSYLSQKTINKILDGINCSYSDFINLIESNSKKNSNIMQNDFIKIYKDSKIFNLVQDALKLNDDDLELVHSFIKKIK